MITRVQAKNFKSFKNLDVALGPINVLVGPNMGGKSNLLDLFRFINECWFPAPGTGGMMGALARRQGIDEVLWKGGKDRLISLGFEYSETSGPHRRFTYESEILGGAGGYVAVQRESVLLADSGQDRQLIDRVEGLRWLKNKNGDKLVVAQNDGSAMELAPPNWDGYPLKVFVSNWRFHQFVPLAMKQANQMTAGHILDTSGGNLSAWLMWLQTKSPQVFARIEEVARDVFPSVGRLMTWPTQQGTVYLASQEQGLLRPTPLFQMSDGELAFIALLSLILAPDDLSGTLFLVEEPENHLHPRLFETLISLLRQGQQEVASRGTVPAQIIFTTHSLQVVDQMNLDEVLWIEKKEGETKVLRPNDKPHLRKLVEDRDLGLGDLMFAGSLGEA